MGFFQYLHHLDKDVTLAINSLHCTFTDYIWMDSKGNTVVIPD